MCDPQPRGARITDGGPCAWRVRHGEPLRVIGGITGVEGGCPLFVMYNTGYCRKLGVRAEYGMKTLKYNKFFHVISGLARSASFAG